MQPKTKMGSMKWRKWMQPCSPTTYPLRHMPIQGSCNFEDCCRAQADALLPSAHGLHANRTNRRAHQHASHRAGFGALERHGGCKRTSSAVRSSCARHAAACNAFKPVTKLRPAAAAGLQPSEAFTEMASGPGWETLSTPKNWRSILWQSDGLF